MRPHYEPGQELAAADLGNEQSYRRQRLRRHNRHLHGWGVVCGLTVVAVKDPRPPWSVCICPGYAIGPYGDEIAVARPIPLDVFESLWKHENPVADPEEAYVVIRASEEPRPDAARIRDGIETGVLWRLPTLESQSPTADLSRHPRTPCPQCPPDPFVVLARIVLPAHRTLPIRKGDIEIWGA